MCPKSRLVPKNFEGKTADEWFQLGYDAEDNETQVECYTKALELDPENDYAWALKGSGLLALEDYGGAIECFDTAMQINPKSLDDTILTKLGGTFGGKGEREKAIWCFTKAIEVNPHNDDSWFWKGYVYAQLERYDEAFEYFDNSLKINKQNDEAWYYKGYVLEEMGEIERAIDCYNKSIEINPKDADNWAKKAKALNKLGKLDDALECMEKANELKENQSDVQRIEAEKINKQISTLNSEINHLTKDRVEKFSEAGELAYSECLEHPPELAPDAQTESDNILAIDTLINKTNQEMEKAKSGKKKTGFLGKLGDTVSSVAKQGKLKVELYNLERKKQSAITDFGEALWESRKSGDDTLQELSDIWQTIDDIEQQIHKNEEEIDNLNELLR